jgi:hypothetical protein
MNKYDEVTGNQLQTDSPKKSFGVPLPGDPSVMNVIQKMQLPELSKHF